MFLTPFRLTARIATRFHSERCLQTAAALSFITLLGLVPMVVIGAALIDALPFGAKLISALEGFLKATLLPEKAGTVIAQYLGLFAHRAERVPWLGLAALGLTALMQMFTIEHGFNALWKVRASRPLFRRLAMHSVALLVGPLVFGAALASISYLAGVSFGFFDEPRWVRVLFAQVLPVVFLALLLSVLYWAVPNRNVSRWHAGVAGLLAALTFVGMQRLFALYIVKLPTYTAIYGAFSVLPVFLLWLHLSWSVILLGALLVAEWPAASHSVPARASHKGKKTA